MHHFGSIGGEQCEKNLGAHLAPEGTVPESETFCLERSEMIQPQKQERVCILGVIGPGNEAANKDMLLLVPSVRSEVE